MKNSNQKLVEELTAMAERLESPIEMEVMRDFLAAGKTPERVRFLLRFHYPLLHIEALAAEMAVTAPASARQL